MNDYYNSYLTTKEKKFVDKITDFAIQKLNSKSGYINITDIKKAFLYAFPKYDITSDDHYIFWQFKTSAENILTNKLVTTIPTYRKTLPQFKPTLTQLKLSLMEKLAEYIKSVFELERYRKIIPKHSELSPAFTVVKNYIDSREYHDLESKLPELKGIFSDL